MSYITDSGYSLTGNAGGTILPVANNISILGSGVISVTGDPVTGSLTITTSGVSGMTEHALAVGTNTGNITSLTLGTSSSVLTGVTGGDPAWSASPTVITMYATTFDTNAVDAGATLEGTKLEADGTDANIDITIKPKGIGDVIIPNGNVSLTSGSIALPNTNTGGTIGTITLNGNMFINNYAGTFVGENAGSVTSTALAIYNCGFGDAVLHSLVNGLSNSGYGDSSLSFLEDGAMNQAYGFGSLNVLKNGNRNCVFGYLSGAAYTGAESDNIIIGTDIPGTLGESNKLRIGKATGNGASELNAAYVCGIYSKTPSGTINLTTIDNNNQLGSIATGAANTILMGNTVGTNPNWSTATYPSTVALGDVLVASAANTVGVVNDVTNAGYVLTANVGAAPSFQALSSSGIVNLVGDDTNTATGTNVTVAGGTNIGTTAAGSTLTVNLDDTITLTGVNATTFDTNVTTAGTTLTGTTWAADGTDANIGLTLTPKGTGAVTVTTGNIDISSGNLKLPTSTSTVGQIQINSVRYLHNYNSNLFLGYNAGNFTAISSASTCVGENAGANIRAATGVTSLGYKAGSSELDGRYGIYIGYNSGLGHTYNNSGTAMDSYNTLIGANTGSIVSDNANGNYHTALGGNALRYIGQNSSGGVFIGYSSGFNIRGNHGDNTFVGSYSGYKLIGKIYPSQSGVAGNTLIGANTAYNATSTTNAFQQNCFLGTNVGYDITTASGIVGYNTFLGSFAASKMTSGAIQSNVMVGHESGAVMTTGNIQNNTFVGYRSGYSYPATNVPTFCINIGSGVSGTTTESYVTRIGQTTGANAQTSCFIGGIYGITPGGTLNVSLIDSNGQLGSVASLGVAQGGTGAATLTDHGILLGSGTGEITPLGVATDGQLPIGSTGADPVLATLTAGANVTVTNGAGSITIASSINTVNDQTDSYQLVAGDAGKFITMTKGTANTLTVPKDATVNFAIGTYVTVYQGGAGTTTFAPEDGTITILSRSSYLNISAQYGVAKLYKIAANTWSLSGDLA